MLIFFDFFFFFYIFSSTVQETLLRLPWVLSTSFVPLMHFYACNFFSLTDLTSLIRTLSKTECETSTETKPKHRQSIQLYRVPAHKPTMLSSLLCRALIAWTWMISLASSLSNLVCVDLSACILACLLASGKKQSALFNYSSQII